MSDENALSFDLDGNPPPAEDSVAYERLSPDERDRLHEQQETQETPKAEDAAPAETPPADEEKTETDEDAVPEHIARNPEDAQNWRELRTMARDFKGQAAERAAELDAQKAQMATLQAEIAALRAQTQAQQQHAQPAAPSPLADPVDNPQAFQAQVMDTVQREITAARFDLSEQAAIGWLGHEKVDAAFAKYSEMAQADPGLKAAVQQAADPWTTMIAEVERRELLSEIGGDPAAYKNRLMEQARAEVQAELAGKTEAEKKAAVEAALSRLSSIPSSIATAPGAGRNATGSGSGFEGPVPLAQAGAFTLDKV